MNIIKKPSRFNALTSTLTNTLTNALTSNTILTAMLLIGGLNACGSSSDSSSDSSSYVKFYNASNNSPAIVLSLDDNEYPSVDYGQNSSIYSLENTSYDLALAWKEDNDDYNTFIEQEASFSNGLVNLYVLSGDINTPELLSYEYEDEDPESEDEAFTFRFINMHEFATGLDVHISSEDETFAEAVLVGNYQYQEMSESEYMPTQSYKFYLTASNSAEVLYESEEIDFYFTSQYIMVIRENAGLSDSNFTLDKLSKTSAVVEYPDKESRAQIQLYNALSQHALLPTFDNDIDVYVSGVNADETISAIAKGEFSEPLTVSIGDYALDIAPAAQPTPFAENHFVSLAANNDKSIFIYNTEEVEEDDNDDSTTEETELYINTLIVENSNRISLYDHQINVINLVDDFSLLDIYFVRSNETVSTAQSSVKSSRAAPQTITLSNNSYDVSILATQNGNELLVAFDQITLNEDSGELFMIIEEDNNDAYSIKFVLQNDN